jgi:hypothetical protein
METLFTGDKSRLELIVERTPPTTHIALVFHQDGAVTLPSPYLENLLCNPVICMIWQEQGCGDLIIIDDLDMAKWIISEHGYKLAMYQIPPEPCFYEPSAS